MGLFVKSITDQTWVNQIKSHYASLAAIALALNSITAKGLGSVEMNEHQVIHDALYNLPEIYKKLKGLPPPRSQEARLAKKNMETAIKYYIEAAKQSEHFLKELYRASTANLAFHRSCFQSFLKDANRSLEEVFVYLYPRIK